VARQFSWADRRSLSIDQSMTGLAPVFPDVDPLPAFAVRTGYRRGSFPCA
jgi:hypothetical protein